MGHCEVNKYVIKSQLLLQPSSHLTILGLPKVSHYDE